jgi:hypothetical protein
MTTITTLEQLEAIYGHPQETSLVKEVDRITADYARFIEASPFVSLATVGPEGLDCSPRGDLAGFVRIHDERTLMMPDRRGNNRCDSLRNIVRDPRVALMFVVPGSATILRVNGEAHVTDDAELRASFGIEGTPPRTVIVVETRAVYFQCARAVARADLWNPENHVDPKSLPTPGRILARLSEGRVGGEDYDIEWPERAKATMW